MGWFGRSKQDKGAAAADAVVPMDPQGPPEAYWRAVAVARLPFGAEADLLVGPEGALMSVPPPVADLLGLCDRFKSLDELETEIVTQTGFPEEDARPVLEQLAEAGILFPMDRLARPDEPGAPVRVDSVGVVTTTRLPAARRCLESFMDNARRHGRSPAWRVFHDGEDPGLAQDYQAMLAAVAREGDAPVAYAGPEEKRAFLEALVGEGLPREVVAFALLGPRDAGRGAGANLNARLLDLVGQAGLSLDDDTFCRLGAAPDPLAGVALAGGDPTTFAFFPDRPAALASFPEAEADWLALHEGMLGRSFGDLWLAGGTREPADLERAPDRLLFAAAAGARVAVTQSGLAGDAGMGSTNPYLFLQDEGRDRLLARPGDLDTFMASRAVARSVRRPTVGDGGFFMTYAVGFDHRQILPPFLPGARSTDSLFGRTVLELLPERQFGHLPWLVSHDPPETRRETEASLATAAASREFSYILGRLMAVLGRTLPQGLGAEDRLRAMGRALRSCGALPAREYGQWLHPILLEGVSRRVMRLEGLLERHGPRPAPWAARIQSLLAIARASPWEPDWPAPRDFPGNLNREEALTLAARLTGQFGALLEHWPDLVAAAGRLREQGVTLARPV